MSVVYSILVNSYDVISNKYICVAMYCGLNVECRYFEIMSQATSMHVGLLRTVRLLNNRFIATIKDGRTLELLEISFNINDVVLEHEYKLGSSIHIG